MRRTMLLTLLASASLAAGSAADSAVTTFRTAGAQSVVLNNGNGRAVVTKRGAILIRVVRGRIRVIDLPGGTRPVRSCNRRGIRVRGVAVEYRGRDVRCRVFGDGPWQVVMRGRGINAGGKVRGSLTLDGVDAGARGVYKIGDRPYRRWPRLATTFVLRR